MLPNMFNKQVANGSSQYFNQLSCTKSVGRYYFRKGNYELAQRYLEESLKFPGGDTCKTLVLISKCQQHAFQPILADKYQLEAESVDPTDILAMENSAELFIDSGKFGLGWNKYNEGAKRRKYPDVFTRGKIMVKNIIRDTTQSSSGKYRHQCLGDTIECWARAGDVREAIRTSLKTLAPDDVAHRRRELYYLEHLAQHKKACDQLLKSARAEPPFYESEARSVDETRRMVDAADQTVASFYAKKPFYLHRCNANKLTGARLESKVDRRRLKKNTEHERIAKYMDVIDGLIESGEIVEARQKTELLIDYKNRVFYKPMKSFHRIFQSFGVVQCLKFQDIDGRDERENHRRKLFLLGLTGRTLKLRESLFGTSYSNPRKTIKKLLVRVHDTKCNMEKMFLHFEIAKCHIQINIDYWKNAQVHVIECFKLAHKMNCHTYIINSTILMGSIEFPTGFTKKTSQAFNVALEYAHSIEEPGVIMFMQKMVDMITVVEPSMMTAEEKIEKEIMKFVPKRKKRQTKKLLENIRINSAELQFSFTSNDTLFIKD